MVERHICNLDVAGSSPAPGTDKKRLGRPKEITNDEAIEVMALAIQGWTVRAIAESVGISKSAVGRIVKESRDDV